MLRLFKHVIYDLNYFIDEKNADKNTLKSSQFLINVLFSTSNFLLSKMEQVLHQDMSWLPCGWMLT